MPVSDLPPEFVPFPIQSVADIPTFGAYSKALASLTGCARLDEGYVDAIAINHSDGDNFALRAASVVGGHSRLRRKVRQDSFAVAEPEEGLLVVAVGDGLGQFPYSHFAATWACQAACKLLADQISALHRDFKALRPENVLSPVNAGLFALRNALSTDFATTLVVGAVSLDKPDHDAQVWLARVGDSTVAALSQTPDGDPLWEFLFDDQADSQGGVATTKTNAVPDHHLRHEHKLIPLHRGTALFLLTDGVSTPLELSASVREGLGRHWLQPPAPLEFASHVSFNRRGELDDRTVVGVWLRP
jgi:Serine/threonine protein phosphatase